MSDRSEIIGGIWAEGASNAPSSPVEGETYAKSNMSESDIINAYGFKSTPDVAKFNEILRRITTLLTLLESNGVLPWCPDTTYEQGGLCIGYNGFTYRSLLGSNINNNPVTTGSPWWDMITLLQASESLAGKARLATLSEVLTGTGTNTIVTPVNLDQKIDQVISAINESWQTMTLSNSWVADYARYRKINNGTSVQIQIQGLDGASATSSVFFTFPSGYRPIYGASLLHLPPMPGSITAGNDITKWYDFYITKSDGTIRGLNAASSGYEFNIDFIFNI
jgi:hypothetical protein